MISHFKRCICYPQENSCLGPPGLRRSNYGPKIDFFKNIFWTAWHIFLIFCMKLDTNKTLRTMYMLPSGKLLPRLDGGRKVKFGLKMDFFKIIFWTPFQNFLIFRMKFYSKLFRWLNSCCHGSNSTLSLVLKNSSKTFILSLK